MKGGVLEQGFDDGLAVVEHAVDGQNPDVIVLGGGDELTLHVRDPSVRIEHHQAHVGASAEGFHRRPAGVA